MGYMAYILRTTVVSVRYPAGEARVPIRSVPTQYRREVYKTTFAIALAIISKTL